MSPVSEARLIDFQQKCELLDWLYIHATHKTAI
jgi:hypothetical protein